ncbi:MAG TPA: hypothetical protein VGV16_11720 [Gammaproteobacteria bacterium]|nr:hypothetical protein [Gammaproteobacteria bacterium]
MPRYPALYTALSILIIATVCAGTWTRFHPRDTDVSLQLQNSYVAVLHAVPGRPLPPGLEEGDTIDLRQQSQATRLTFTLPTRPVGQVIDLVAQHNGETRTVPVTVMDHSGLPGLLWYALPWSSGSLLMAGIGLLLIWRGRDRAAFGMGFWAVTFVLSAQLSAIPLSGWWGFAIDLFSILCYLTARAGFYIMVEARVGAVLGRPAQRMFLVLFGVLLALGAVYALGAPLGVVLLDWNGFGNADYGLVLTASYLVPVIMLYVGYRRAEAAERQRLRWMLMSGILWSLGILLQNTPAFGLNASYLVSYTLMIMALLGFLYAVLRLRVVDVSVIIDRALVYGAMSTLMVGVVAALNSLALHETLTPGAGFALQVLVPLAVGIVLVRVRNYLNRLVEQVFFRGKYLAEKALRTFTRRVGYMEDVGALLDAAAQEIKKHAGTPALAIYSVENGGYRRVRQLGADGFPEQLPSDDAAFVALRADRKAVDLEPLGSALGTDGYVFPMLVLGNLRGAIVCRNRPGEHFAADEQKLLTRVAREVGAAWRILRARDNEALVQALAEGALPPEAAREKARELALSWGGA